MQLKCIAVQSREMHYGCLLSAVKRTLRGLVAADATRSFAVLALGPIRTTTFIAVKYERWARPHAEPTASIQKSGRLNDWREPHVL